MSCFSQPVILIGRNHVFAVKWKLDKPRKKFESIRGSSLQLYEKSLLITGIFHFLSCKSWLAEKNLIPFPLSDALKSFRNHPFCSRLPKQNLYRLCCLFYWKPDPQRSWKKQSERLREERQKTAGAWLWKITPACCDTSQQAGVVLVTASSAQYILLPAGKQFCQCDRSHKGPAQIRQPAGHEARP